MNSKDSSAADDITMIRKLKAGDVDAFEFLYNKYHAQIYYFALKFVKSGVLAEEMVHDAFLKIWENRDQIVPDMYFRPYLYTITKNHILNLLARSKREQAVRNEIFYHADLAHTRTEDEVVYSDYEQLIEQAILKLPPQRQLVFKMCRLEGKSYEEVAAVLGITIGTVSDHMVKAGRFMREFFFANAGLGVRLIQIYWLFY